MTWRVAWLAFFIAPLSVTCAKPKEKSFEVPYSEAWQEQIMERGREFTVEHKLNPEDFDTVVLDANGAKVKRGQKPDSDNFPLRVKFVPKRGGAAPKRTFTLEYGETWREEMGKQMKAFGEEHSAKPDQVGVSVLDVKGENVKHDEQPEADRFPIKIVFQLPTQPGQKPGAKPGPKPGAKPGPGDQAPRLDAKGGPPGFKLDYSEDWTQVMGKKMMEYGKRYGVTPDMFWPKISDKHGEVVNTGADLPKDSFPLDVLFIPRERKPPVPGEDGDGEAEPAGGHTEDMSMDIRCDFCEVAAKKIASSLAVAASFKRSDDVLAKLEDFCDGLEGEDDIGTAMLNHQYFVFWNSSRPKDDGTHGRWNLMHLDVGDKEGEKVEDMVDPKFKEGMRSGIAGACEKTVDEHQVELSEKLFKQFKKSKVADEAFIRETLCVKLSKACPKAEEVPEVSKPEKRTDL